MGACTIVVGNKKGNYVTWCTTYKFDPEKEIVILYGDYGNVCGTVNMKDVDFKQLDIYNAQRPTDGPIQTFLPAVRVA